MNRFSTPLLALSIAACGGGGGGGGPPTAANQPPVITSPGAVSVPENTASAFYQATAFDPEGNGVTYQLAGADAARFTISGSGAIGFAAPPDFEAPNDSDANNVYLLTLVASDGSLSSQIALMVTVTNVPDQVSVRRLEVQGDAVAPVPGSSRIFVATRAGQISVVDPASAGSPTPYLTVSDIYATLDVSEYGLLNIVAAPDYATSGNLYVLLTNSNGDVELRRYGRLSSGAGDPASADVILRVPRAATLNSESLGGGLVFGPDQLLYVGIGEGRSRGSNPDNSAQNLNSLRGKILRLDVGRDDFPADANRDYGIPAGNPFTTGAREILAYGLDNPRRMSFDGSNLLIGDAHGGIASVEMPKQEVNLLRPQDAGANFGYPFGIAGNPAPPPGALPPVIRLAGTSNSSLGRITGGYVYRGPVTQFNGLYIFADLVTRNIFSVPAANIVQGQTIEQAGVTSLNGSLPADLPREIRSFGIDSNDNLYFVPNFVYVLELR
ncbi:MAG: PQQ-dependent sugar dehydrogenase [Allosphingosinicella sp.]